MPKVSDKQSDKEVSNTSRRVSRRLDALSGKATSGGERETDTAFIARMRECADRAGSVNALAELSGVSQGGIRRYFEGGEPNRRALVAIARAAGVTVEWLATGKSPKDSPSQADVGVEFQLVPQYDVEASAGGGAIVEREAEIGKLAFRHQWLREKGLSAKDLVVIRVRGDSMAPTIRGGSIVLVDTRQDHVTDDGIYVLLVGEHLVAKRLQVDLRGGLYIISDNPAYEEQHLTTEEAKELYIVGRVVWAAGDVY